eukprot:2894657-Rhodomonas_salina.1
MMIHRHHDHDDTQVLEEPPSIYCDVSPSRGGVRLAGGSESPVVHHDGHDCEFGFKSSHEPACSPMRSYCDSELRIKRDPGILSPVSQHWSAARAAAAEPAKAAGRNSTPALAQPEPGAVAVRPLAAYATSVPQARSGAFSVPGIAYQARRQRALSQCQTSSRYRREQQRQLRASSHVMPYRYRTLHSRRVWTWRSSLAPPVVARSSSLAPP